MKELNITKERFEKSRYFQKKYGKLEYVSESGTLYKTNKGKVLMFNEDAELEKENPNLAHAEKALSLLDSLPRIQNGRIGPTEFEYVVNSDERLSATLSRVRMELEDIVYGKN